MKKKLLGAVFIVSVLLALAGCRNESTYINKEYTLSTKQELQSADYKKINLDDYRIQDGAIISLKDVIKMNDMLVERVCFYDKDNLLILFINPEYTRLETYLFSLEYGNLSWMGTVEDINENREAVVEYSVLSVSPIVIAEGSTGKMWVVKDKTAQGISLPQNTFYTGTKAVGNGGIFYIDENSIKKVNFLTGEISVVLDKAESYEYSIRNVNSVSEDGRYLFANGMNKISLKDTTFVIDLETKDIETTVDGTFHCWKGDNYVYSRFYSEEGWSIHRINKENYAEAYTSILKPDTYFESCIFDGDVAITEENDEGSFEFSLYDLAEMKEKNNTIININSYYLYEYSEYISFSYCIIDEYNGYNQDRNMVVFTVESDTGCRDIFLWDIAGSDKTDVSVAVGGYTAEVTPVSESSVSEVDYGNVSDIVHRIYDEYGVAVYVGENNPYMFNDFCAESYENMDDMLSSVKIVEKVLNYYPGGFFKFFTEDNYLSGVNIYLVGSMTPTSEGMISDAAGFATTIDEYEVIALDVNYMYSIESNICHEISHAIYKRIEYEELITGGTYFDETSWNKLNPPGFQYYEAYINEFGEDYSVVGDHTKTGEMYYEYQNPEEVYFVDAYSKTFITEDLARLMEYGMIAPNEEYLSGSHIKEKMRFYYKAIRKVWDTTGWPEETLWEKVAK